MSQYDAVAIRTLGVIRRKGGPVTFGTATDQVYDPLTDTWTGGAGSTVSGQAVQIEGDPERYQALHLTLTDPVTLMVAASGLSLTPTPGMAMTWAGVAYTIKDAEAVAPDGTPILWTVTGSR